MRTLAISLLLAVVQAVALAAPPRARPEALAERFVDAWKAHSFSDFGEFLTADTDWVTASGRVLRGKPEILLYLAHEHATWARTTTMSATGIHSRAVSADIVVVRLEWTIGESGSSDVAQSFPGITQFVATHTADGWRVLSGQVTSGRGRRSN